MLVLGRKQGETIVIDDTIEIRIVGVSGSRVKLAIDAPRSVAVQRGELRCRDNGVCAASYNPGTLMSSDQ
ncbi:MAG: carbon storage regulator [Planctomycetales bacterium]|nr:carbon storage regulator [Planctomycetales bacterium]MCA9167726.1 carbon storage regulator [Planctomycetales bacterium]